MPKITNLNSIQVLDSRGTPTIRTFITLDNSYDFMVTSYTAWNLYSNSEISPLYFFGLDTTTTVNPPFVPTGDLETWELSLIIACIVIITILSSILMNLRFKLFSFKLNSFKLNENLYQITFFLVGVVLFYFLNWISIPILIISYIIVNIFRNYLKKLKINFLFS